MWARSTKKCLLFKVNSCDGPLVQLIIVVGVFILIPDVIIVIVFIFLFNLSMEIFQKTLIKKVFQLAYQYHPELPPKILVVSRAFIHSFTKVW